MKALITDICSPIGYYLCQELLRLKYQVKGIANSKLSKETISEDNLEVLEVDLTDFDSVSKAVIQCDVVFHTAMFSDLRCRNINKFYKINVAGTKNVLQASWTLKINKVILTNPIDVYGMSLPGIPITETQPRINAFANDYELTRTMAEEQMAIYAAKGLSCVTLNVSNIFGPDISNCESDLSSLIKKIMTYKLIVVPYKLNVVSNYVFIDDVVNAHILALQNGKSAEKYIIGGENITYTHLIRKIGNIANKEPRIFNIRFGLLKWWVFCSVTLSRLFGINSDVSISALNSMFTSRSVKCIKAKKELFYVSTPLKVGLERVLNFNQL